ncbi:MAG: sodium:solute symporter family protein [Bacteriovoracaceae bacterium]
MNAELVGISLYVLGMLILGFYVSKKIKTDDDYFLAGRSLGPFLATFSIFATWFGAETCIGTAGAVYENGLSGSRADPFGYAICIFVMGVFFAKILWNKKITTIPDLFRDRFSPNVEKLAAFIIIPSSIIWAGAQIRAFGQIIHSTTDFGVTVAVTVAALVVIMYTVSGGLLADAYTDLIQGFALIAGLLFLLIAIVLDAGGISSSLAMIGPERLTFRGSGEMSLFSRLEIWMVPILGSVMSQELVSRVVASKSSSVAFRSSMRAGLIYLLVGSIPVMIGLLGPMQMSNLADPETIMPLLAKKHLSYVFYVMFVGALVSAILSTVDSTLLSASALMSHNLIYPQMKNLTERKKVIIARVGVLASGVVAYIIAFSSDSIISLVELASTLGGPTVLVITVFALFVPKGNATSAMVGILSSVFVWILTNFVIEVEAPVILTVMTCVVGYVITIPWVTQSEITQEVVKE